MENLYDKSWGTILQPIFEGDYWHELELFVKDERDNFDVYPSPELVFNALKLTPFPDVKVVILGQDPYHNVGQAHGLAFSVPVDVAFPPSLKNIFTELSTDVDGFMLPISGDLSAWAQQGVLLLNATLTVRAHLPGSHQMKGWELITDSIIQKISNDLENVVFILWGKYAQKKSVLIDSTKHLILKSAHPSPLSVYRGFWGSKPFSKTNLYLQENGKEIINWQLG